jgi:hypothetical protein
MSTEVGDIQEHIKELIQALRGQELQKAAAIGLCIYGHWGEIRQNISIPSQLPRRLINDVEEIAKRLGLDLDRDEDEYGSDYWAARTIVAAFLAAFLQARPAMA